MIKKEWYCQLSSQNLWCYCCRLHTFSVSSYYNFTASLLLYGGVPKSPTSGILWRHMNLSAIFPFKIDLGLYWLQRNVLNYESKCSIITEQMERPFSSIHFFLKFMNFKAVCWISGAHFIMFECSGLAIFDFFLCPHTSWCKQVMKKGWICLVIRLCQTFVCWQEKHFGKAWEALKIFLPALKKSKLHLCIPGHTDWNNFWNGDYTGKNVFIYIC